MLGAVKEHEYIQMQKQALTHRHHHHHRRRECLCAKSERRKKLRAEGERRDRMMLVGCCAACLRARVAFLPMRGDTVVVSAVAAAAARARIPARGISLLAMMTTRGWLPGLRESQRARGYLSGWRHRISSGPDTQEGNPRHRSRIALCRPRGSYLSQSLSTFHTLPEIQITE